MARGPTFNTMPTDLLEYAELTYQRFQGLGYSIKVEPLELGYPKTPAMSCSRSHTTVIIEICQRIDIKMVRVWAALCRSTARDLRIALCLPKTSADQNLVKYQLECKNLGVGIYVCCEVNVHEITPPQDVSVQIHLPDLKDFPKNVRTALGSAYEQFDRKQWREGFEEACKALEQRARRYLQESIVSGRLSVYQHGKPKNPTTRQIDKMTIGSLAETFGNAQPQNSTDSLVYKTLSAINPDRVGVAHKLLKIKTEKSLRSNVGVHMHSIVQALKQLN